MSDIKILSVIEGSDRMKEKGLAGKIKFTIMDQQSRILCTFNSLVIRSRNGNVFLKNEYDITEVKDKKYINVNLSETATRTVLNLARQFDKSDTGWLDISSQGNEAKPKETVTKPVDNLGDLI